MFKESANQNQELCMAAMFLALVIADHAHSSAMGGQLKENSLYILMNYASQI